MAIWLRVWGYDEEGAGKLQSREMGKYSLIPPAWKQAPEPAGQETGNGENRQMSLSELLLQ